MATSGSVTLSGGPRVERATGVTGSGGLVTFTWPVGAFTTPPVIALAVQAGDGFRSASVTANSATSTTVLVAATSGVTLLGLTVLGAQVPASGVTVHATATAAAA